MRLPSRFVITALRQTFLASILKAYIDSRNTTGEKVSTDSLILIYRVRVARLGKATSCGPRPNSL